MRCLSLTAVFLAMSAAACAQDVTVHVVDAANNSPVRGVHVNVRQDTCAPKGTKIIRRTTGGTGTALFRALPLDKGPVSMDVSSTRYAYTREQVDVYFATPEQARRLTVEDRLANPIVSSFPADVIFYVQRRSLRDRLRFIFKRD